MTTKEQSRIQVLNGMVEGQATVAQASGLMGVSEPHRWRLLAAYMKKGAAAILRARSGRRSNGHVTSNGTSTHSVHKANPPAATKTRTGSPRKPAPNHPWRRPLLTFSLDIDRGWVVGSALRMVRIGIRNEWGCGGFLFLGFQWWEGFDLENDSCL